METVFLICLAVLIVVGLGYKLWALQVDSPSREKTPQKTLSAAELEGLQDWAQSTRFLFVSFWVIFLLGGVLGWLLSSSPITRVTTIGILLLLASGIFYRLMSGKCPRCGLRFYVQTAIGLSVPGSCRRCGVALLEAPSGAETPAMKETYGKR